MPSSPRLRITSCAVYMCAIPLQDHIRRAIWDTEITVRTPMLYMYICFNPLPPIPSVLLPHAGDRRTYIILVRQLTVLCRTRANNLRMRNPVNRVDLLAGRR